MEVRIDNSWQQVLQTEFDKPYFAELVGFVRSEYKAGTVYPPARLIFNAFDSCPFDNVRVVIIGQDPYHGAGQAHGLAFSVREGVAVPPSLVNIYKELADDIEGFRIPQHGYLQHWAEQGVLLLNTVLTVRAGQAHSHATLGWERFTDEVVNQINQNREHVVFMLWGSHAQKKGAFIDRSRHLVLSAPHPSPLSAYRGFFGCKHFSRANAYLQEKGITPIDWQV